MHAPQLGRELRRRDAIAELPTRRVIRLAEREDREAARAQRRLSERGRVRSTVEHDVLVNLVAKEIAVVWANETREPIEISPRDHGAGRIVRRVHDHEPRAVREGGRKALPVDRERRRRQRDVYRTTARERDGWLVRVVARVEHD